MCSNSEGFKWSLYYHFVNHTFDIKSRIKNNISFNENQQSKKCLYICSIHKKEKIIEDLGHYKASVNIKQILDYEKVRIKSSNTSMTSI